MTAPGRDKVALGIIGCGHWGPNHIRVFSEMEGASMRACCDTNAKRLERIAARYPEIRTTTDYRALLADDSIDAVVIATPTRTHFAIAADALRAGKHVLVEKPMCATAEEAKELAALVEQTGCILMVGYVFLFNNGIRKLREIIASGGLGHLHYLDAVRTNLGPVRGDVNALYDLGTHDITIFNYFVDGEPVEVSATGRCISQEGIEDVCFATIKYANGTLGHIHVSWLNPRKIRTVTAIGERKMAHWDDVDPSDTLRVYDKGLDEPPYYDSFGEFHYLLRNADVHLPAICPGEPLAQQAQAFIDWIVTGKQTGPDVRDGWNVVAVLEAATRSMRGGGTPYPVATFDEPICTQASALVADVVPRSMDDRSRKPAATLPAAMDAP